MPDTKTEVRSADSIVADMDALLTDAGDGDLTDEQVNRYEGLERELQTRRATTEVQKRHAAYKATATAPLVTGSQEKADDTLERAFSHYLRTGRENADLMELRAQSEGTTTAGGFMVPRGFRQKLIERMVAFGGIANAAETITTDTGNLIEWPTVDDTANLGEIVAENGTFASGADLVFGQTNLSAYKYMAGGAGAQPMRVSVELLQDAAFNVEDLVARKLGERIARIQASHLVNGTGSSQPKGIVNGLTGIQTAANTGALTYADLLTFVHSVDPAYRANAKWAFNDTTLAKLQGLVDTTGRPLLNDQNAPLTEARGGQTLLGYPVIIDQAFSNVTAGSATVNWGAFGDFKEGYVVRRVRDIQVMVNPYNRQAFGQVEYMAWARMDAKPQNPNSYVALTDKV